MDVLQIPGINLFDNINYMDYDYVKNEIISTYAEREIAYETPNLFKMKLNNDLRLHCDSYNKMLRSQLIEIDPFVTEYIELYGHQQQDSKSHDKGTSWHTDSQKDVTTGFSERDIKEASSEIGTQNDVSHATTDTTANVKEEAYGTKDGTTEKQHTQNTQTNTTGSTDTTKDTKNDTTAEDTTKKTEHTSGGENTRTNDVTKVTEHTNSTTDQNEKTTLHSDQGTQTDVESTDNQTGLKWTETGSSQGHTLNVHSDTPQTMLFNEPNHYYGTGRAHDYGIKRTSVDDEGNEHDYYEHYPEFEPSAIDAGSYKIGSGDTPWYNYATNADNQSGHDNYNKSGTEEYQRGSTSGTKVSYTEDTNGTDDVDTKFDQFITSDTDRNITTGRDYYEDKTGTSSSNKTQNSTGNETGHGETTSATTEDMTFTENGSSHEETHNTKNTDSTQNVNGYTTAGRNEKNDKTTTSNDRQRNSQLLDRTAGGNEVRHNDKDMQSHSATASVRKGRTMRSPSQLLKDYRSTLTFNADLWLLGELRHLFLELY